MKKRNEQVVSTVIPPTFKIEANMLKHSRRPHTHTHTQSPHQPKRTRSLQTHYNTCRELSITYISLPPLTLAQTAPDLDFELDEVLAGVEGEEGDVLVADHGQHVALPLQGEARLQPQVAIQGEGGLHLAPGPQRLVYVLVQDQLQSVCKHQMGRGEQRISVEDRYLGLSLIHI